MKKTILCFKETDCFGFLTRNFRTTKRREIRRMERIRGKFEPERLFQEHNVLTQSRKLDHEASHAWRNKNPLLRVPFFLFLSCLGCMDTFHIPFLLLGLYKFIAVSVAFIISSGIHVTYMFIRHTLFIRCSSGVYRGGV